MGNDVGRRRQQGVSTPCGAYDAMQYMVFYGAIPTYEVCIIHSYNVRLVAFPPRGSRAVVGVVAKTTFTVPRDGGKAFVTPGIPWAKKNRPPIVSSFALFGGLSALRITVCLLVVHLRNARSEGVS